MKSSINHKQRLKTKFAEEQNLLSKACSIAGVLESFATNTVIGCNEKFIFYLRTFVEGFVKDFRK